MKKNVLHAIRYFVLVGCLVPIVAVAQKPSAPSGIDNKKLEVRRPSANQTVLVFEVSKGSRDKTQLEKVFAKVRETEAGEKARGENYRVMQRLGAKRLLVHPMIWRYSTVTSSLGSVGGGGGSYSTAWQEPNYEKTYLLETEDAQNAVDGETIENIIAKQTDEIFEYATAAGAMASARIIRTNAKPAKEPLTKEQFVARLRNGETWLLTKFSETDCRDCFGKGTLGALRNNAKCESCDGSGSLKSDCLVTW